MDIDRLTCVTTISFYFFLVIHYKYVNELENFHSADIYL